MATIIDTLVTVFTMDKRGFDDGAKDIKNTLQGLKSIAQSVGAIALFGYGSGLIKDFVNANTELARFSDTIHANMEDVQAWGKVLEKEGGSIQSLQGTLTRLSMLSRGMREPTQLLRQMADRMKGMSYWQAKMYGSRFGIDEATIRVLQKGGREVDRLLARAKQLGVYNKAQLEQARKLKNSWIDLGQSVGYFGGQIAMNLLPAIQWMSEAFTTFGIFINEHSDAIKDFLTFITGATIIKGLKALGVAGLTSAAWLAVWIVGLGLLFLAFNDLMTYLRGGDSVIGRAVESWNKFAEANQWVYTVLKLVAVGCAILLGPIVTLATVMAFWGKDVVAFCVEKIVDLWNYLTDGQGLIKDLGNAWKWFCDIMKSAFSAVYTVLKLVAVGLAILLGPIVTLATVMLIWGKDVVAYCVEKIVDLWNYLTDGQGLIKDLGNVWKSFCNIMKSAFSAVYNWFVGKWDALIEKISKIKNFIGSVADLFSFGADLANIPAMAGGVNMSAIPATNNNRTTTINVDRMEFNSNGQTPLQFTQNSANQFLNVVNQADVGGM